MKSRQTDVDAPPSITYVVYPSTPAPIVTNAAPGVSSTGPGTYWAAASEAAAATRASSLTGEQGMEYEEEEDDGVYVNGIIGRLYCSTLCLSSLPRVRPCVSGFEGAVRQHFAVRVGARHDDNNVQ